ncbi:hypothetical protein D3C78_1558460 [compost metagenome]
MRFTDSDDQLQIFELLVGADMLKGLKCLLKPHFSRHFRLNVECDDGEAIVLECDQRT